MAIGKPVPEPGRHFDALPQKCLVDQALVAAVGEQSVHQCDVRTGAERQMQVGILAGFRAAGVDDDELRAALSPRRLDALVDDRMAPRSAEQTSELQSLMSISYAVLCLNKKTQTTT